MTNGQALSSHLWPNPFRWQNFVDVFHQAPIWRWALNTMIYAVLATLGVLVSSIPVAYALSRIRWRGRNFAFGLVLIALMLPPVVAVVPLYVMWAKLGLVGGLGPLIIPNWFGDAFSIFLLRQFFLTIPEEYLDAARVDGCGELRILFTVVLRLAKPAIAAVALFSFLYTFNDFFLPLLYTRENPSSWVLQIGLSRVPLPAPGAVESHHGGDAARDGARDHRLLPGAEGLCRRRDAHRGQGMKIAVIGGGSTYTPELVSGLSRERERIDVTDLVLQDIDPERREVVGGLAQRMLDRQGYEGRLEVTDDLDRAVDGADFVLIQIRVGGQDARLSDETVPLACGCIGQETTGAGGLGKALRTVPVVLGIADRVRERAADGAWIVDFTNPVGIVTRSLLDHGHQAVGLCNVAIGWQRSFARMLGVEPSRVQIDQVGLNHLSWVRQVRVDGDDVLADLMSAHGDEIADDSGLSRRLLDELGVIPSYYLHYFYSHDAVLAEQLDGVPRATTVAEIERELLEMYRDPNLVEKPPLLEKRGGAFYSEAAIGLVGALAGDTGEAHVVDVRNNGTIEGLADDDVIEVLAEVGASGAKPLPQAPVAPELLGLMQHVTAYERLAAQAAVSGDPAIARKALLTHPLIGQHPLSEELVDLLLEAGAAHLPQFHAEIR